MSRYDFTVGHTVTKQGAPFLSIPTATWHNIPDEALEMLSKHAERMLKKAQEIADKGGELTIVITHSVVALDGGPLPPGVNGEKTITGVTYDGLNDYEDEAFAVGDALRGYGREHAKKRKHKHGGHA